MNETTNMSREPRLPNHKTLPGLRVKENNLLEPPRLTDNTLLYIEKIRIRAETVTPILKDIEGYPGQHGKN